MYRVQEFFDKYKETLCLTLCVGAEGLKKQIKYPEANRPGLSLLGILCRHTQKRMLVFGKTEIDFLNTLGKEQRVISLVNVLDVKNTPAVFFARGFRVPKDISDTCRANHIPLFRSKLSTLNLISKLTLLLVNELAPTITCHGTLMEVFGLGVLVQGSSSVGKSEVALGLLERRHCLVSDDAVKIKRQGGYFLEGTSPELTRFLIEIRGIGIVNVVHLYGAVAVRPKSRIDLVVKLETWNKESAANQQQEIQRYCKILDVQLPLHHLFVNPGSNLVSLLETIALKHRLSEMGYDPMEGGKKKKYLRKAKMVNFKPLEELNQTSS